MASATLKGRKDGYEIHLDDAASFTDNLTDLTALFHQVHDAQQALQEEQVNFVITTGNRLLTEDQETAIRALLDAYPHFEIVAFRADVVTTADLSPLLRQTHVPVSIGVIRSGQEREFDGDILFIGAIHHGGVLKASGSVFCIGEVSGIVYAGYPDDAEAVVVGDLTEATQVRIADMVDIVDSSNAHLTPHAFAYVNDLHAIDYAECINLRQIRPRLYAQMEE